MMDARPFTLLGTHVRLVPLLLSHVDALCEISLDPSLWHWTPVRLTNQDDVLAFVEEALAEQRAGTAVPFATMLTDGDQVIGSTRFMSIVPAHRRVEIGGTWIAPAWQRTRANTESKYLMLQHAFEEWKCMRVELKTHAQNVKSRAAILRIGAKEEGTLRKHMLQADGSVRDSVYYSILDDEWPNVKQRLEAMLRG